MATAAASLIHGCRSLDTVNDRRQPNTSAWVLSWLLALFTLAGISLVSGNHCRTDTPPPAVIAASVAQAMLVHTAAVGTSLADHAQRADGHTAPVQASDTAAADCHAQPAPSTASTLTTTTAAHPPAGTRNLPVSAARPPADTSRPACAVALIDIGISRT